MSEEKFCPEPDPEPPPLVTTSTFPTQEWPDIEHMEPGCCVDLLKKGEGRPDRYIMVRGGMFLRASDVEYFSPRAVRALVDEGYYTIIHYVAMG